MIINSAFADKRSKIDSIKSVLQNNDLTPVNKTLALKKLSIVYRFVNIDSSVYYILQSLEIVNTLGDSALYASVKRSYGNTLFLIGRYDDALQNFFTAIKLWEEQGNYKGVAECFSSVGEIYRAQADYSNALRYINKAYRLAKKISFKKLSKNMLQRFAAIYYEMSEHQKALTYADSAIQRYPEMNTIEFLSNTYNIIGACYQQLKYNDSAVYYLRKSINLMIKQGNYEDLPSIYNNISLNLLESKNYDSSVYYAGISLKIAKRYGILPYQEIALLHISNSYKYLGNIDSAFYYYRQYSDTRWNIFNSERDKLIAEIESKYEMGKKEQKNQSLLLANNLQQQKISNQRYVIALIILFAILVLIIPFYLNKKRQKLKKSNEKLLSQHIKIENQANQLLELNKTKDKILSIIAHDIKNPFHSIQGFAGLMADEAKEAGQEQLSEYANLINQGIENLNILLNNLLEWSQMQTGNLKIRKEINSIYDISLEIEQLFRSNILDKNIEFINSLTPAHKAYCDRSTVSTIIRNLLSNAIKFTPANGKIRLSAREVDNYLEVTVVDNGTGMRKETVDKLFTQEKKISRGTRNEKGSGLGLLLCKEFVELNGGNLNIQSAPGKGTQVTFTIPLTHD